MGLFKSTLALRRYRVMQKPPEAWREQFDKSVRTHALVPIDREGVAVKSTGWCSVYDAQKLDFDAEYVEGHIWLSLRMDVLKPDPAEVKKQVKLAAQRLEAERKVPLSKAALRDVKALVVLDMRKTTPIKTRTVDAVWNLNAQRLYVLSQSKKANEIFISLFAQTFHIPLDIEGRASGRSSPALTRLPDAPSWVPASPRQSSSAASAVCVRASWLSRRMSPRVKRTTPHPTLRCPLTMLGAPIGASWVVSS